MNNNLNLLHTIIDPKDVRGECRYELADADFWHLQYDDKLMPAKWIVNLSQVGASIRTSVHHKYQVGDILPIRIQYYTDTVIDCLARVKWTKPYDKSINMVQLGLEYISPEGSARLDPKDEQHETEKLKRIYTALKKEPMTQSFQIQTRHYLMSAVSLFTLGFFLNL